MSGSAEQVDVAFTKEPVQVTTPAAAAGDAPSRAPLSSSKATTAGAGSAAPAKKKKEKSAKGPKADSMATGEAASAPYSDELDAPWSADSSATMMSSFFASSAALRQAMPQLQSKSKPISEVSALNECNALLSKKLQLYFHTCDGPPLGSHAIASPLAKPAFVSS